MSLRGYLKNLIENIGLPEFFIDKMKHDSIEMNLDRPSYEDTHLKYMSLAEIDAQRERVDKFLKQF
jgi:hypothetical protein